MPSSHSLLTSRRIKLAFVLALSLAGLALPSSAFGQATRTWVSGVGDDANPCSRTAPCKTFAGAITKTAADGEINALDPGGFGTVTITKSITIAADGVTAGVLGAGMNGIVVNAGANDRVTLRGLDVNGAGTGLSGVRVVNAGSVRVENSRIYGFSEGIDVEPIGATTVVVQDTAVNRNRANGVVVAPPAGGTAATTLRRVDIDDNTCGAVVASTGYARAAAATNCGTSTSDNAGRGVLSVFDSSLSGNAGSGVLASGARANARVSNDKINDNFYGLRTLTGGTITSFGDNRVIGNFVDGSATSSVTPRSPNDVQAQNRKARDARIKQARHRRKHRLARLKRKRLRAQQARRRAEARRHRAGRSRAR